MKLTIAPSEKSALADRVHAAVPGVTVVHPPDLTALVREIADTGACYGTVTPELLVAARRLRWVQSPLISLERVTFPALIEHLLILTNPRGIFSEDIADHVLGFVICFARQLPRYFRAQQERRWAKEGVWPTDVLHLPDTTIGIFGPCGIGCAVATRAAARGMRVIAVDARRIERPPDVSELWGPGRLPDLLGQSTFVAICAPETDETRGLFDRRVIGLMRPDSYLLNVGLGKIVRLDALVEALERGVIAGAGLDVFETEPLPAEHPLWGMENVIVTPHVSGAGPHIAARREAVLVENLRRFVNGQPLENVVDKARWF